MENNSSFGMSGAMGIVGEGVLVGVIKDKRILN